ncbi:MAG: DUF2272 domain-containing protein [Gammaproteobacteria bacterium]|nr:DUF2272 domain-containing protein [Gammaproteobacteria bacterium]
MQLALRRITVMLAAFAGTASTALAQDFLDRHFAQDLLAMTPSERVSGEPGRMRVVESSCRSLPMTDVRRRIVNIAVQEWAYFGFNVVDETIVRENTGWPPRGSRRSGRRFSWLDLQESARVADSIAGYWAITSDGSWILNRQNQIWAGSDGVAARWRDPWSAAFISWVMCESGMGESSRFQRAIAHHTYIDQAIEARDRGDAEAAFIAYDVGERAVEPGDLVCAARRPTYVELEERRRQLGVGIRSHCDIVIKLEPDKNRILAIGGNVRGTVSLKLLPADFAAADGMESTITQIGRGRDTIFAHLKLRADVIEANAFDNAPTWQLVGEEPALLEQVLRRLAGESS